MICSEELVVSGKKFIRTYSDTYMLIRNGVEYEEAIDPADSGRTYTESSTTLSEAYL